MTALPSDCGAIPWSKPGNMGEVDNRIAYDPPLESGIKTTIGICRHPQDIPARYVLSFLTFWGMSLEFAHRVCFSVTIVAMVNHTATPSNDKDNERMVCPASKYDNATLSEERGTYDWSPSTQGIILGSYFYGFVCTQLIGGRLAEMFGGKWLLGFAILIGSILTILTPKAADLGVLVIVMLRIMMGLIHGVCLPTVFAMFSEWAPQKERSTLVALCVIGDHVGTILSMPLAGFLCEHGFGGGWPSVFYVLGSFGLVWFFFWCYLAYSVPDQHPRISRKELAYIKKDKSPKYRDIKPPVPWKSIITSMPVWSIAFATFSAAWGHTTLLTKLPTYLEVVLHVPIQKNGFVNSLIYVNISVTLFCSGYFTDYLRTRKCLSPTIVRKTFQLFATLGPALCTALIPYVKCDRTAVIALLTMSMAFLGFSGGGHVSIVADMAPTFAGTIFGLVSVIGCTAGFLSPLVAGLILDSGSNDLQNWNTVFYVSSAFYIVGAIFFTTCASADLQEWAYLTTTPFSIEKTSSINCADVDPETDSETSAIICHSKDFIDSYKYGSNFETSAIICHSKDFIDSYKYGSIS